MHQPTNHPPPPSNLSNGPGLSVGEELDEQEDGLTADAAGDQGVDDHSGHSDSVPGVTDGTLAKEKCFMSSANYLLFIYLMPYF